MALGSPLPPIGDRRARDLFCLPRVDSRMQEIAWLPSWYQNDFGKIHIDRDRKVQVLTVHHNKLELDKRFNLDFNTACLRALPSARSGEQVPPRWPHVTTPVGRRRSTASSTS